MLAPQRQTLILQEVSRYGAARISELAENLSVSEMTIRRDIDSLAEQGLLEKVHGGAVGILETSNISEPPFKATSMREQAAKDAIAARASELVKPGNSIALMGGSTVFAMAKHIAGVPRITVVTNSLPVSDYLHREGNPDQVVILTGGMRTPTDSFVGEFTIAALQRLNLDLAFIGTHGVDVLGGFSSPNLYEAETNRSVRQRTKKFVVLADHTKWGKLGFSTFAGLKEADLLITDDAMDAIAIRSLRDSIQEVITVKSRLAEQ
jgi:DeoR/GlpR family transcriptional regulator of sugar metabolism